MRWFEKPQILKSHLMKLFFSEPLGVGNQAMHFIRNSGGSSVEEANNSPVR